MPAAAAATAAAASAAPIFDYAYAHRTDPDSVLKAANALTKIHSPEFVLPATDPSFDPQELLAAIASSPLPANAPGAGRGPAATVAEIVRLLDEATLVPSASVADLAAAGKAHFANSGSKRGELTPEFLAERLGTGAVLPDWVDVDQIRRASNFHWENVGLIYTILLHGSLAGAYGVPRIDRILHATGRIGSKDANRALQRLVETQDMITNSFHYDVRQLTQVGGLGWRSNVKVRLIHAGVRYRLAAKLQDEPTAVINQADMVTTLLSFSSVVLGALQKFGYRPTRQELTDYVAAWRFIGYLNGIQDRYNPCQWGPDVALLFYSVFYGRYSLSYSPGILVSADGRVRGPTPTNTASVLGSAVLTQRAFSAVASVLTSTKGPQPSDPIAPIRRLLTLGEMLLHRMRRILSFSWLLSSSSSSSSSSQPLTPKAAYAFTLGYHSAMLHAIMGPTIAARLGIVAKSGGGGGGGTADARRWELARIPQPDLSAPENAGVVVETFEFGAVHVGLVRFTIAYLRFRAWLSRLPVVGPWLRRAGMRMVLKMTLELYEKVTQGRKTAAATAPAATSKAALE
ncbi:hypothetical protein DFJ73DRAFT_796820 [Zopfochytrium polystomum]|nr:hypothetical protein DFJ73DRAFT_796820 [Zopfochytrium polystomum]